MKNNEKLTFSNDRGQTLEISVFSPLFPEQIDGLDSMDNSLYSTENFAEDGVTVTGSKVRARNIVIKGRIRANKEINRAELIRFFNPKHNLTLMYTNGEIERFIKCKVEKSPVFSRDIFPSFVISLLCPKPWWYSREIKTDIALWVGALTFPLIIPEDTGIIFGYREPSLIVNVNNESDNVAPLRLEFRALGSLTNPSIINVETQEFILIETEMVSGDVISVNTERGNEYVRLTRNGVVTNIFNDLSIDSNEQFMIGVGDNLLRYDATENVNNLEVAIYFTPQYVGV